jgi:putative phosphoesterase
MASKLSTRGPVTSPASVLPANTPAVNQNSPWLFPGRRPSQPMNPGTLRDALRQPGVPAEKGRTSAIRQLVLQAPAPVIAQALGYHDKSTTRIATEAGAPLEERRTRRPHTLNGPPGLRARRKITPLGCLRPTVVTMLNRVAVLSDIHGVLPALKAVLAEPDVSTADHIVLTGDITAGPQPAQVLDLLTSLGDRVIWISGNADRELLEYRRGQRETIPDPIAPWAAEQLREDHLDLLGSLPRSLSLSVNGLGKVLFCHATPRDDEEVVLVDSRLDRWEEVFDGLDADIRTVVCGHTHMPFVRLAHGRLVINPGSIGMPYGRTGAHWALLGPGVELRTTHFDLQAAATQLGQESSYPEITEWADYFLHARATDADALTAFAPRDGRDHSP